MLENSPPELQQQPRFGSSLLRWTEYFSSQSGEITQSMSVFILIWFGQVLSLVGSRTTGFALSIWVYQHTNSTTQFTLLILSTTLPTILISPIAGVVVDRWSRRWIMIISDFCAGLCTLLIAWLFISNHLEVWSLCVVSAISSSFNAFQGLAYSSATTLLVPKAQLGRASSMTQIRLAIAEILSPVLAAALLVTVQLSGIVIIDLSTLILALICLLVVKFPEISSTENPDAETNSFWQQITFGWKYLVARPGLLGLVMFIAIINFLVGSAEALTTPLVLSFASAQSLGTIYSIASSGLLVGSVVMSIWGGLERQINTIFVSMAFLGILYVLAGLKASTVIFTIANFLIFLIIPIINGSIQVIYQKKVAPEVQGRVFAFRSAAVQGFLPLSYLTCGALADQFFEPIMAKDGALAHSIGQIIGVGHGRGMGLMFIIMGLFSLVATLIAYLYPRLRCVEHELPDAIPDQLEVS
jgi:MFS family permease